MPHVYSRQISRTLWRPILRLRAGRTLSELSAKRDPVSASLATALRATIEDDASEAERLWIAKIESLRTSLEASPAKISMVDYGARASALDLTDEEMNRGALRTRTIGELCRNSSKSYFWSFLLFKLVRQFKPLVCLELGTCLGISAAYQAAGLKVNGSGKILSLEGAQALASRAEVHLRGLGLDNAGVIVGRFQDTLDKVLNDHAPIDHAFIDGHHDENATVTYFEKIVSFASTRAVLVFDDISWSQGMQRAWRQIQGAKRVKVSLDLSKVGICILGSDTEPSGRHRITLL